MTPPEQRTGADGAGRPVAPEEEISLLDLVNVLLRHRWTVLAFLVVVPAVVAVHTVLQPRSYTATASFMPQAGGDAPSSRLSSLAGQFGIDLGSEEAGRSPQFYADLLTSREILGTLAADTFEVADTLGPFARGELRGALAELLEIEAEVPANRRAAVIRWLRESAVSASTDPETGVVELSVRTPWPELSGRIAGRLVEMVNQFNLETRQSRAAAERSFIEERLDEARDELRAAENELEAFLRNNRQFQNSPELVFQHDRLQRRVDMRQQVVTSLTESYEQARINEVRNTPVITVVEEAEAPVRPDPRNLRGRGLLALVLGAMLGVSAAFVREYARRSREESTDDYTEFSTLWSEAKAELSGMVRGWRG